MRYPVTVTPIMANLADWWTLNLLQYITGAIIGINLWIGYYCRIHAIFVRHCARIVFKNLMALIFWISSLRFNFAVKLKRIDICRQTDLKNYWTGFKVCRLEQWINFLVMRQNVKSDYCKEEYFNFSNNTLKNKCTSVE